MKYEIIKKTFLYRGIAFILGLTIPFLITGNIIFGLVSGIIAESVSIVNYYLFEIAWQSFIRRKHLKGLQINIGDKMGWYSVVEVLGDNKFIIEVV